MEKPKKKVLVLFSQNETIKDLSYTAMKEAEEIHQKIEAMVKESKDKMWRGIEKEMVALGLFPEDQDFKELNLEVDREIGAVISKEGKDLNAMLLEILGHLKS